MSEMLPPANPDKSSPLNSLVFLLLFLFVGGETTEFFLLVSKGNRSRSLVADGDISALFLLLFAVATEPDRSSPYPFLLLAAVAAVDVDGGEIVTFFLVLVVKTDKSRPYSFLLILLVLMLGGDTALELVLPGWVLPNNDKSSPYSLTLDKADVFFAFLASNIG